MLSQKNKNEMWNEAETVADINGVREVRDLPTDITARCDNDDENNDQKMFTYVRSACEI